MKTMKLKWLLFENFKGAKKLRIDFSEKTTLRGDNATFKTTSVDGIYWLLFGKNSNDDTKFSVKTLDQDNKVIPDLNHSVTGCFEINGVEQVFKRILFEKWVKPHGELEKIYKGDETKYEINLVSKQKKEFDSLIAEIITPELFKLLSNPMEFNRLHWEQRRSALIDMSGGVDVNEVIKSFTGTLSDSFIEHLTSNKSEVYKSELASKLKPMREELKNIPIQIGEKQRDIDQIGLIEFEKISGQITAKQKRVNEIDSMILESSKKHQELNQKQTEIVKQIGLKEIEAQKVKNKAFQDANADLAKKQKAYNEISEQLNKLNQGLTKNQTFISESNKTLEVLNSEKQNLLNEYYKIQAKEFVLDESKTACPTCKRDFDNLESIHTDLESNFNTQKAKELEENKKKGLAKKSEIYKLEVQAQEINSTIPILNEQINENQKALSGIDLTEKEPDMTSNLQYTTLLGEIRALEKSKETVKAPENIELTQEKSNLNVEINALQVELNKKDELTRSENRIAELNQKERILSQEIADLEKEEHSIEQFEKATMAKLEQKVNSMFTMVKFKMFQKQKNGGEKPDCITLVNGVPYSDANTASKINAGVDICNILQKHHEINVPIVVDNRESVSRLVDVDTQIINLFKDENYKTLTVE